MRWPWSPQGCPRSPTTCACKLWTDPPFPATTGGSGSATDTHKHKHTYSNTLRWGGGNFLLTYLVCVFVFFSPTERRASPVYTPATACLRKKLPAITGRIRTPQPFLCPGPQFHQVSPLQPRPLALLCNIFASRRSSMTPAVVSQLHSSHTNISIIRATVLRCVIGAAVSYQR